MTWQNNVDFYERVLSHFDQIERKGKSMPYTSVNGHMFSFVDKEGRVGLRLSKVDRDVFLKEYKSSVMEQHGRVMKEYVVIPQELLEQESKLQVYFDKSLKYVLSLKPKVTKRKA